MTAADFTTTRSDVQRASELLRSMPPRFHVQSERRDGALSWAELLEPATLRAHIDAHGAARNIGDPQIAASMFVQGLSMYVGGATLAAEFSHGIALRANATELWVVPGHPSTVWGIDGSDEGRVEVADDLDAATTAARVEAWTQHWLAGHFAALIDAVRSVVKVGRRMLEGNVASATAANFVFLDWWDRTEHIRNVAELVAAHPLVARHATLRDVTVQGRTGLRSERSSCCLLLRVDGAHACPTCPMVDAEERIATTTQHVGHLLALRPLEPAR